MGQNVSFIFLMILVMLPFLFFRKSTSFYPQNTRLSNPVRNGLLVLHFFAAVILAIVVLRKLAIHSFDFRMLLQKNEFNIHISFFLLVMISALVVGACIELLVRRLKK